MAARPRGRPSGGQHVADRDAILDAAERVIARDGSGASLDAIAVEAGITKPIVYARVGHRAALSNALAVRLSDRLITAAGAEVERGALGQETLAAFLRATLETIGAHRELFLYVTRGSADDTSERALYLAGKSAAPLADMLRQWREHQGLDAAVARPWAYAIIGMLNMVALWWIAESDEPVERVADHLASLVWAGLQGDR